MDATDARLQHNISLMNSHMAGRLKFSFIIVMGHYIRQFLYFLHKVYFLWIFREMLIRFVEPQYDNIIKKKY
jgi:hypothetical protein